MHTRMCNTLPVLSVVAACKHSGQFADLRKFADRMPSNALRHDLTSTIAFGSARGMMSMGCGMGGKKKSHPEHSEHSHARVVR